VQKGCKISDHGFEDFYPECADYEAAQNIFKRRNNLSVQDKRSFFGYMLRFFAREYKKRDMTMQLHFSPMRNVNGRMFGSLGGDAGFDVFGPVADIRALTKFLDDLSSEEGLPRTILYTLNPGAAKAVAAISGAFPGVLAGPAWWFNDTLEGIREQLKTVSEYAVLGTNLGMLTDSRSFTSYVRFDFFRRILSDFIGNGVERGEYDGKDAGRLMRSICYENAKKFLII
jgi:glucuronate isomerase